MNLLTAIALVTLSLHGLATVILFAIARAPGWNRARTVGFLSLTAALYSLVGLGSMSVADNPTLVGRFISAGICVVSLHASIWLWFTFSSERRGWRSLPLPLRVVGTVNVLIPLFGLMAGGIVNSSQTVGVDVPVFGIAVEQPALTIAGLAAMISIILTLAICLAEFLRRYLAARDDSGYMVTGFALLILCTVGEALTGLGYLSTPYLMELGYIATIFPVTAKLFSQFVVDAEYLARISGTLADEVDRAVSERDDAIQELADSESMAALGRIATGLGHEISNPLQYVLLSVEELRDETRGVRSPDADQALANVLEGIDRIQSVVNGLRTYSRGGSELPEPVALHDVVRAALRVASPHLVGTDGVKLDLKPVEPVLGIESKLVQMLVNTVVNAAQAVRTREPGSPAQITISVRTTEDGFAEVEVRDNGPGFPEALLQRLGEPFLTTRRELGGTGLGIFVIRGVARIHGADITFENAAEGGAVVRVVMKAQVAGPEQAALGARSPDAMVAG